MNQLNQLEQLYNSGSLFPKALRELLLIGGNTCYALNHLWYKTQQEIQSSSREWLIEYNTIIERPFFVIDVYNVGIPFYYIYLDEGENPTVYKTFIITNSDRISIESLDTNLTTYINNLIDST